MSPPAAGNEYVPFVDLMRLVTINDVTYRSTAQPFYPGGNLVKSMGRAYGGHVFAQAAWAAAQTVPSNFVLHNVTGWFILAGLLDVPFVYKVHNIRDGRSYCTRIVNVTQASEKGVCFTCTCSFKTEESSDLNAQEPMDLWQKYDSVLEGKKPDDFPEAPGMDVPGYHKLLQNGLPNDKFPGLTMKRVDMSAYNDPREPLDRRQLIFYRPIGELPSDLNLHVCAHLYASDRNSLFIVANHLEVGSSFSQMGSLTHTVIFHAPLKDLRLESKKSSKNSQGNWFCKEDRTDRASVGRANFHSRVFSPEGVHVISIVQDGMIRIGERPAGKDVPRL
jgi:acyl-CoA thioesterase II